MPVENDMWRTRTGELWRIEHMENDHLVNSLRMVERMINNNKPHIRRHPRYLNLKAEVERRQLTY